VSYALVDFAPDYQETLKSSSGDFYFSGKLFVINAV